MSDTGHFENIEKTKSDKFKTKSEKGGKYFLNCSINIEFSKTTFSRIKLFNKFYGSNESAKGG